MSQIERQWFSRFKEPTHHPTVRDFSKKHSVVKFQITRVKEKILDDSRKEKQILYKGFRLLNSHNGNQNS